MPNTEILSAAGATLGFPADYWMPFASEWARYENTAASNNPLACIQVEPGSSPFNDAGVQNYDSEDDGANAIVATLDPRSYGGTDYYPHVRAAILARSLDANGARNDVAREIATWGTHGFANAISGGWNPTDTEAPAPENRPDSPSEEPAPVIIDATLEGRVSALETAVQALNSAVLARFAALAMGAEEASNPGVIPGENG